jgi:hypothetical protein
MKFNHRPLLLIAGLIATLFVCAAEARFPRGSSSVASLARSQLNPNSLGDVPGFGEYKLINALKEGSEWNYADFSGKPAPSELDANGYPLSGANAFSHGGVLSVMVRPSQAERAGNYVFIGTGSGSTSGFDGNGASIGAACTGTQSGNGNQVCDNTACTALTGKIDNGSGGAGTTLTVTVASSCSLVVGQPISNGSTTVNAFGIPTIITGKSGSANCPSCTGTGGTGTYLVNWSQNVASGSINPGIRNELTAGTEVTTNNVQWFARINSVASGNTLGNMAFIHKSDEALYASGQLTGVLFKQRVQQGNFAVLRDLDTFETNITNVTTWATRKPTSYFSYVAPEMRASLYAGVASYALNGSSNDYSATLGSGAPVDKQTVCVKYANTATNATVTFNLNGTGAKSVIPYHGGTLSFGANTPSSGDFDGLTFDATLNGWLNTKDVSGNYSCLYNFMPPEAFAQMNSEVGTNPWLVEPYLAADPITDFPIQEALYFKNNFPSMVPEFEVPDETWNCAGQGVGGYSSAKSRAYIAIDTEWATNSAGHGFCGSSGDINNWTGKAGSLLGQAIRSVSSTYPVIVGVQTAGNAGSEWNDNLLSTSYINQNSADIPTQSGCAGPGAIQTDCPAPFTKTAAYKSISDITIANYWSPSIYKGDQRENIYGVAPDFTEVALAYCYFSQASGCASQSSIMSTYMATQYITNPQASGPSLATMWSNWYPYAQTCAGGSGCTPLTVRNYEGTYTNGGQGSDIQCSSGVGCNPTVTSGTTTDITLPNNGAVVGMSVTIQSATGGTWSSVVGNTYQVTAVASGDFHVSLNSTGLGTATALAFSYTGSANYVTYMRAQSYLSPDLRTLTTLAYNTIAGTSGACSPHACSINPSQFNLSGPFFGTNADTWLTWSFDTYGYFQIANCTSCTISGSTLTLGGTVKGIFGSGQTVLWGSTTPPTISGACSTSGPGPAGSNAGDTCPLSASFTVSTGTAMSGNATPPANQAGNSTTSPVQQWNGICAWNNNANACGG